MLVKITGSINIICVVDDSVFCTFLLLH